MDAMGYDIILVETVGVGQDEVEVVSTAHTSVVVVVPGLGDEIQAIKAGILEIADILTVNKADREGADRTVADLSMMLDLRAPGAEPVEILKTSAIREEGIPELVGAIDAHRARLDHQAAGERRARDRARIRLLDLIRSLSMDRVVRHLETGPGLDALADRMARREIDPYTLAEEIINEIMKS
jgi:LAO/AO transport system kinase